MSATRGPVEPDLRMTREEYLAWVEGRLGRYERVHGVVVSMAPERSEHALAKGNVRDALRQAIRAARVPCTAYPDGMTVQVDDSDYEPDAIVRCGDPLAGAMTTVPDPLVIVEVLSPSTSASDRGFKFGEYFRLASARHYLIVWPDRPKVVHHRRDDDGEIRTEVFTQGPIRLDPPGIAIQLEDIYAA
jgi:Uma2 family endonuclease